MEGGYLLEQKWLKDRCITKAHPSMGDSSQKLGTRSPLHSLQTAQQVEECPFQVPQLVETFSRAAPLLSASCRQLVLSLSLLFCFSYNHSHYTLRGLFDSPLA